jgi:hypothetical protein
MSDSEPIKVLVAVYEYGATLDHLTIPRERLVEAERLLDEERTRRRLVAEAAEAKAAAGRAAARKSWFGRLGAMFQIGTNRRGARP